MQQLADKHRMVQVGWSTCQHRTLHAQLSPQGAQGYTASERVREVLHQLGWP